MYSGMEERPCRMPEFKQINQIISMIVSHSPVTTFIFSVIIHGIDCHLQVISSTSITNGFALIPAGLCSFYNIPGILYKFNKCT